MGYSPPKGRSPTCYSPVRHSHETPKGLTPVRLACLIRAASVRSEPGSNSPLYCVASHSEEQEAHFSYSVLQQFVHPLQTLTLSILTSSLIFPSLLQKNTSPPLPQPPPAFMPGLRSSTVRAFSAFQRSYQCAPQDFPTGEYTKAFNKRLLILGTRGNILRQLLSCQVHMGNCAGLRQSRPRGRSGRDQRWCSKTVVGYIPSSRNTSWSRIVKYRIASGMY